MSLPVAPGRWVGGSSDALVQHYQPCAPKHYQPCAPMKNDRPAMRPVLVAGGPRHCKALVSTQEARAATGKGAALAAQGCSFLR